MSLATQAAEYASAVASAYAMGLDLWAIEDAIVWSDEAIDLAWRVRSAHLFPLSRSIAEDWAETAARLMNGEY